MYFKNPELLYALLLLVIPILVHLFQLRKFRTTQFTNVKFLRKAVLQTRKSSRLKKFLILCTRLLMLACLVLAFAQPYFPPESGKIQETQTVIYLDNSYSMQARGENGVLMRRSVQDLLENIPGEERVTLFTNEEEFTEVTATGLQERLQNLEYSSQELSWRTIQLKAQKLFRNSSKAQKNFLAISDFQNLTDSVSPVSNNINTYLVQLKPENIANHSIDTAWIENRGVDEILLNVSFSATADSQEEVSVGLYNGERMLARKTVALEKGLTGTTSFNLGTGAISDGRIELEDNGLQFDNKLYFSINDTPPIQVVVIGDAETGFLERIYSGPEFALNIFPETNIDYNLLSQANVVILNQPEKINFSLVTNLEQLLEQQVVLVLIPSAEASKEDYNLLLRNLDLPSFNSLSRDEKLITGISFDHPLFRGVFNDRVTNFEYPKVQSSFPVNGATTGILKYQNGQPFLYEKDRVFIFTAALDGENSNFKSSPLIVPTFYNIANLAITRPQLYHILGNTQEINIQANLQKDEILKLSSAETTIIPQQQSFQNKVKIILNELPRQAGHYRVLQDSTVLRTLSFNVSRRESEPVAVEVQDRKGISVHSSIPDVFSDIRSANEVESLWKWFVIFTLFFLLTELLILKFLK